MDSITHTLMGLTVYGTVKKKDIDPKVKKSIFVASAVGSQIPDIDMILQLTEKGRLMYQMWHRGVSHSLIMAPIWALVIYAICYLIWKVKDKMIFCIALLSVFLHIGFDSLNTWGTGIFEPFASTRVSLGLIPIVDVVIWVIMLIGLIFTKVKKSYPKYKIWRIVWIVIFIHVAIQSVQGQIIHNEAKLFYEKSAISASFVPWNFSIIGKNGDTVEIYSKTVWTEKKKIQILHSKEETDLTPLFAENLKAEVLAQWSPFVVIIEDQNKLGIYDPRFYRNGSSFLFEYVEKK
ncbi:membrane-bound metal-dependent hydrolase [Gottschalkia acidurici 9a]|uniref:Membrane-bound metal-dependent hydrolase n=1 Tax=Gottschalkia acidurici (strain ATCC 7906 / DSM 604 / BCRC 14475 / CIP 104303 / KCTC 5404 / NCIMB 10678 / 9a) TaxID=1128398 RepID=K0AXR0_GOTA9|nr:metal-dependent hydrolase [Gottschalkia acidurici]AFS77572.1 membrane-bound metal-dependent hydrolase [Gottschalkia acidurici 9a]